MLGEANGHPIRAVTIFSRSEWTALVVRKDSPIKGSRSVSLRQFGKRIAALFARQAEVIAQRRTRQQPLVAPAPLEFGNHVAGEVVETLSSTR